MSVMNGEDWRRVNEHLDRVLDMSEPEAGRYVAELMRADPSTAILLAGLLSARGSRTYDEFLSGPGPTPIAPSSHLIGQRVGPYLIEAEVGHGGMGSVWRARRADGRFEGTVAVKFLRAAWLGSAGEQRFKLEGRLLAKLDHPNIARLLDAGVFETHQPYLILEYVDGEPIDTYCSRMALDLHSRLRLFAEVLAAVSHAHTHLIVHRDLKPGNILVTPEGTAKLLDFGIAKLLEGDDSAQLTRANAQALTPEYAAPEQLLGQPVTTATDVYSLGLVLYTLLTGAQPLAARQLHGQELIRCVLTEDLPRVSTVTRSHSMTRALTGDLDNIVAKALKKDPAERYPSAAALADDLQRHLRHEPVQARPDTIGYRVSKFARRNSGGVAAGVAIALGLIATTSFALTQMSEARRQRDAARAELLRAEAANDFSSLMLEEVGDGGRILTRRQLLDRGVELLDARHGSDPAFVAEMLTQLAGRFGDEERNDRSMALTQRALAIARTTDDPGLLALTLCSAAHQEHEGGIRTDVDRWLAEAARELQTLSAPPLRVSTTCLRARAWRASDIGDATTAAALLEQAHALQLSAGLQTGLEYTSVLNDLGYIYYNQGRYADAYATLGEVGAAFDRGGRGGTLGRIIIHENAATLLMKLGEIRAAYAEFYAASHPPAGGPERQPEPASRGGLSVVLRRIGRLEEARTVVAGQGERLVASSAFRIAARTFMDEAAVLIELNESAQARALLERGIEIETQHPTAGGTPRFLAESNAYLADIEIRSGDPAAARQRLEGFLASQGYPGTASHALLQSAILTTARADLRLGDLAAAESYARDALHIAESTSRGPDTSADVGESLLVLAQIKRAQRDISEARPLLTRALRCLTAGVGPDAPATIQARAELAQL
jgi:eukaryotic-like serine/threonine-protein kinase